MEYDLSKLTPDIRWVDDMRVVLFDQNFVKSAPNSELYYMYRGLEKKDGLRYDILAMPARMLGNEFMKTKGHYHVGGYSELYIVLEGKAIFLLQKPFSTAQGKNNNTEAEIEDVCAIRAKKGDVIIVPSYYGHVTTNCSETEEMKIANWVALDCKSDYSAYEKLHGACYYYTKDGWIKNKNYKSVPQLRFEEPLKQLPQNLDFLKQE